MSRHFRATVTRSERAKGSLSFERLEERCLLARSSSLLVVDFTTPGDVLPLRDGGFVPASSFADQFATTSAAQRVIRTIGHRIELLLSGLPNPPRIVTGGLTDGHGTDTGQSALATGRAFDSQLTDVIYASGRTFMTSPNIIGVAFLAPEGSNLENYGFTFPAGFSPDFRNGRPAAAVTRLYAIRIAAVIAHEYGHLLGLGHVLADPVTDTSLMNNFVSLERRRVNNVTYSQTELLSADFQSFCGPQNAFQELARSLDGSQPIVPGSEQYRYSRGGPVVVGTPTCVAGGPAAAAVDHLLSSLPAELGKRFMHRSPSRH